MVMAAIAVWRGDCSAETGLWQVETLDNPFGACANCKSVKYCTVECQKKHWKKHRKACKEVAAALSDEQGTVRVAN